MRRIFALLALVLTAASAATAARAAERFPILQPDAMNAEQKKLLDALLAGPRGGGDASPEAVQEGAFRPGSESRRLPAPAALYAATSPARRRGERLRRFARLTDWRAKPGTAHQREIATG